MRRVNRVVDYGHFYLPLTLHYSFPSPATFLIIKFGGIILSLIFAVHLRKAVGGGILDR